MLVYEPSHLSHITVQTELEHLWSSQDPLALDVPDAGLDGELLVLGHSHAAPGLDGTSKEDLPSQPRVPGVGDVVLPHVPVDPVGEVEVLVVHADQDVSHHSGHLRQHPAVHFLVGNIDDFLGRPVSLVWGRD